MKTGKVILAILLSSFIGIISNPEILTASDSVKLVGMSNAGVVQTSPLGELLTEAAGSSTIPETGGLNSAPVVMDVTPLSEPSFRPVVAAPADSITVSGKTIPLETTYSLEENAGTSIKAWLYEKTGKFIYAHNYPYLFGSLKNLKNGDTFSVNLNGITTEYEIKNIVIYTRVENENGTVDLQLNGSGHYNDDNVIYDARSNLRTAYDMALMTCHGENDSERLVVFANAL